MDLTLTTQYIRICLKENFGTSGKIRTTLSSVIKIVIDKYPGASAEQIKTAMANIEGWSTAPVGTSDQIEITPAFFN